MQRAVLFIVDMVAGHEVGGVTVPATGLCPPNVEGYVRAGLLPTFRQTMDDGVFVRAWNQGICNTPHGMRYLASGSYHAKASPGIDPYWKFDEMAPVPTILSACKVAHPDRRVAAFGSDAWMQTGWWKAPDCTVGYGSYYSDFLTMQCAFGWMLANPDWNMVLLYIPQYDQTGNCPVFKAGARYTEDKHHSLQQVDRYLWMLRTFLQEKGWWDETGLFVASDHGCHVGCEVAVTEGRARGIPEADLSNYCSNHQAPHDCRLWDFERQQPTDVRSDDCRRTLFMVSGGALDRSLRGRLIERADIIDVAPTVASLMGIPFSSDGRSVL
jgi:hypothetical protein